MNKSRVLVIALIVSLIFNLISLVKSIREVQPVENQDLSIVKPGVDEVSFDDSEKGAKIKLKFQTEMSQEEVPVQLFPPLKFETKWHDAKTLELHLKEKTVPGKKYFVRTSAQTKDQSGMSLPDTFKEVFSQPLKVEKADVISRMDKVLISLKFNGAVSSKNIKKYVSVKGQEKDCAYTISKDNGDRFELSVNSGKEKKLILEIAAELKAEQAEKGLGSKFVKELSLNKVLKINSLRSTSERRGGAFLVSFNRSVKAEELQKFLQIEAVSGEDEKGKSFRFQCIDYYENEVFVKGDFKASTLYKFIFKKGLESIDKSLLAEEYVKVVQSESLQNSFEFISKGPLFPAGRDFKIPVRVVGHEKLKLKVTKVYPNNLVQFFSNGYYDRKRVGKTVLEKSIETGLSTSQEKKIFLDFGDALDEKGIYVLTIHANYTWNEKHLTVIRTDLGLSMAKTDRKLQVWAFDVNSGLASAGVNISLLSYQNQTLLESTSNEQGLAEFDLKPVSDKPYLLRLQKGDDISYRNFEDAINLSAFRMKGAPFSNKAYEAFIFTERDICRPGETIDVSMIIRKRDKKAAGGFPLELKVFGSDSSEEFSQIIEIPESGFISQKVKIGEHSRTGYWKISLGIPGDSKALLATKEFLVNTYTPDSFKVKIDKEDKLLSGNELPIHVSANYNFGGALSNASAKISLEYSAADFSSEKFRGFHFGDKSNSHFRDFTQAGKLNEDGKGNFEINLSQLQNNSTLPAVAELRVNAAISDANGETVSSRQTFLHMSQAYIIGLSKEKKVSDEAEIKWVRVNSLLEKAAYPDQMSWQLSQRKWHYTYKENSRGDYVWNWACERIPLKEGLIRESSEEGILSLGKLKSGLYELTVSARDGKIHTVYPFDIGQSSGDVRLGNSEFVKLYSDRAVYKPGDTARLRFESPADGTAVLRISDLDLYPQIVKEVKRGWNVINFTVPQSIHGNFYTALTLVRKLDQQLSLPPRFFGLQSIRIDNEQKRLALEIEAPEKAEPGERVKVSVKVKGVKSACKVKLMAVDEGVLSLTAFKTPSPFEAFYGQKELRTKFIDVFDDMFPEINENFGTVSLAGGGGEAVFRGGSFEYVKSHLVTLGIQESDEQGNLDLEFDAPEFNGAMRIMAIAVNDEALGHAERKLTVKDRVTVMSGKVKALTPGDVMTLPVSLFNNEEKSLSGTLTVVAEGSLKVLGSGEEKLSLNPDKSEHKYFKIQALDTAGDGLLRIEFKGPGVSSVKKLPVNIRPAYARVSGGISGVVAKGVSRSLGTDEKFLAGTEKSSLVVSTSSASEMYTFFQQLQDYPYGCLEQTASRAVVNLYGSQLAPEEAREKSAEIVKAALARIGKMQTANGGFGMWPGANEVWASATVYAGHFIAQSKERGFEIDAYMLRDLKDYLQRFSENQFNSSSIDEAYSLYVLACLGSADKQKALAIIEEKSMPVLARMLACGVLSRSGDNNKAADLFRKIEISGLLSERITWDMDSKIRRLGLASQLALDIFGSQGESEKLYESLVTEVRAAKWLNTQDKALLCMSAGRRAVLANESPDSSAVVSFNGQSHEVNGSKALFYNGTLENTQIKNSEKGPVYFSYYSSGIPLDGGRDTSNGIEVSRSYLDKNGQKVSSFKVGDLVQVKIKVKAAFDIDNTVILDLLPGCLAVESAYLKSRNGSFKVKNGVLKHYEGLDDRMIICTDLQSGREVEFTYTARLVAAGSFNICGLSAEGMYKPQLNASVNSREKLEVVKEH